MLSERPTVLLGWEVGEGFGHIQKLLRIANALSAQGFWPVLAIREIVGSMPLLLDCRFPIVQAPFRAGYSPPGFVASSFADVLAINGFGEEVALYSLAQEWISLLDTWRPALVVADFAPSLCLAAAGLVPTVLIGTGFVLPPADLSHFPILMSERPYFLAEEEVLATTNAVQRRLGRPESPTLPALFRTNARFVTCLPELDPYRDTRNGEAIGPLEPLGSPRPKGEPSFFAYLAADTPGCEDILTCLANSGIPGRAYVRGVSSRPIPMSEALASAVIVHHGGASLAQAALAAGRPQLLFPSHLEQLLNARRLHKMGVAHCLTGQFPLSDVVEGLKELMGDSPFLRRANEVARDIEDRGPWDPLNKIVECCQNLVKREEANNGTQTRRYYC